MKDPIRVLIADDHAIVRAGLKQIAASDPAIAVTGEAASAVEAIEQLRGGEFDVVVLDLSLPDRNGIEILGEIKSVAPHAKVLILSMESEQEFAIRSMRAGAWGYLEKRAAPDRLMAAIKMLGDGRKYLSAELAQQLALKIKPADAERPHDALSRREFEVFLAIADGKPVRQIAADLKLSVKTVNNHRAHILEKLGVNSTAALARYAIRHHLVR